MRNYLLTWDFRSMPSLTLLRMIKIVSLMHKYIMYHISMCSLLCFLSIDMHLRIICDMW